MEDNLQILWTVTTSCLNLPIILLLQTLHGLHGLLYWPRLSSCPPLIHSDPKGKKHQYFSSIAEGLMLSEYWSILSWPMASSIFSAWRSEGGTQASFPVMNRWFPGTLFWSRPSHPTAGRGSITMSRNLWWFRPFLPSPLDTTRTSPFTPPKNCLWWSTCLLKRYVSGWLNLTCLFVCF